MKAARMIIEDWTTQSLRFPVRQVLIKIDGMAGPKSALLNLDDKPAKALADINKIVACNCNWYASIFFRYGNVTNFYFVFLYFRSLQELFLGIHGLC